MENNVIIQEVLNQIIQKTHEKKINWTSVNPNVFRWVKTEEGAIKTTVTLQKIPSPAPPAIKENYVLTIQGGPKGTPSTQLNSVADQSYWNSLRELFQEVSNESLRIASEKQAEVIKNLLKGL